MLIKQTYGGGVQSMMGVTGAQRASAEARTTIETRPFSAERSRSVTTQLNKYYMKRALNNQPEIVIFFTLNAFFVTPIGRCNEKSIILDSV